MHEHSSGIWLQPAYFVNKITTKRAYHKKKTVRVTLYVYIEHVQTFPYEK